MQIDITTFPGMSLRDAWIEISTNTLFHDANPSVLVVGSTLEFEGVDRALPHRSELEGLCTEIASAIEAAKCNLINGACPGLPDVVMQEFAALRGRGLTVGLSAYASPKRHRDPKEFAPSGFPISSDVTVFCGTGFELLNVLNTLCADVLVVVGGGVGTLLEAATAVEQEIPVICLTPTGGVAKLATSLLQKFVASFKSFSIQDVQTVDQLKGSLCSFANAFRRDGKVSRLSPLIDTICRAQIRSEDHIQITVPSDLSSIGYKYRTTEIKLHDPVLMTDRVRVSRVPGKGEIINYALHGAPRSYNLAGTKIDFTISQGVNAWGPSIDTLMLIDALENAADLSRVESVLEIGCGSGALGIHLARRSSVARAVAIDVSETAIICAERNAILNGVDGKMAFHRCSYFDLPRANEYDLAIANPPYIPVAPDLDPVATEYAGSELLYDLLATYQQLLKRGGVFILMISSASLLDLRVASTIKDLRESGVARRLRGRMAPFNVAEVLLNARWLDWLTHGGGVTIRDDEEYKYWHQLEVLQLSAP